jgi:hypothetical protein
MAFVQNEVLNFVSDHVIDWYFDRGTDYSLCHSCLSVLHRKQLLYFLTVKEAILVTGRGGE